MGKSSTNGPFSMAMLNDQRVIGINSQPCDIWMCLIWGMPSVMAMIGKLMIKWRIQDNLRVFPSGC